MRVRSSRHLLALTSGSFGFLGFLRGRRAGLVLPGPGRSQGDLVGLLVDHHQQLPLPDERALLEVPRGEEAADPAADGDILEGAWSCAFGVTRTGTDIRPRLDDADGRRRWLGLSAGLLATSQRQGRDGRGDAR